MANSSSLGNNPVPNNMAVDKNSVAKRGTCLEDLWFELVEAILSELDDYEDLISVIRASRLVHSVFTASSTKLLTRIAQNSIAPGGLQPALRWFYCNRDNLPTDVHVQELGECVCEAGLLRELRFPTEQAEIAEFFYREKRGRAFAETLISTVRYLCPELVRLHERLEGSIPTYEDQVAAARMACEAYNIPWLAQRVLLPLHLPRSSWEALYAKYGKDDGSRDLLED
ncbi:hypothetical protein GGR55DRAFT_696302 [Xylaria sp. FL0064]|nr:hypothetical protein GGR55DRAFT_696302 [Xylaria sp. FL0064]